MGLPFNVTLDARLRLESNALAVQDEPSRRRRRRLRQHDVVRGCAADGIDSRLEREQPGQPDVLPAVVRLVLGSPFLDLLTMRRRRERRRRRRP